MSSPHTCTAGCGKIITYRFAICADCESIYGRSALEWPPWLRERWNMIQRERRQERRIAHYECFSGLHDEVLDVAKT